MLVGECRQRDGIGPLLALSLLELPSDALAAGITGGQVPGQLLACRLLLGERLGHASPLAPQHVALLDRGRKLRLPLGERLGNGCLLVPQHVALLDRGRKLRLPLGERLGNGCLLVPQHVALLDRRRECRLEAAAFGSRPLRLQIGLDASAELGKPPAHGGCHARRLRCRKQLAGRSALLAAHAQHTQSVIMQEREMRMAAHELIPKAPNAEVPLPYVDVVK